MTGVLCIAGPMLPAGWCLVSCLKASARGRTQGWRAPGAGCSLDVEMLFLEEP